MNKLVRFLFVCTVLLAIGGGVLAGLTIWYFGRDLPDYQQLAHYQPPITTRVQAGDGRLLAEYATERRVFVPIAAIPKPVINAFIAAEDKNFYTHHGVDPISMLRAALTDIGRWHSRRRPIGASTITQQVAKNMLLTNELSMARKIKEILLATRIDSALPKDRILELYLNEIYLGSGAYGVAAAAQTYFGKSLDQLTLGEAAFLAGLPKAPNNYSPARFPQAAKARRDWVLDRIAEDGCASTAAVAQAKAEPLAMHGREEAETVNAPYFAEEVRRELLARYGEKALYAGGLSVRTSLDPAMQAAADKTLREGLIAYDRSHGGWRGAVGHIDAGAGWPQRLAANAVPAGADALGWQLAVVLQPRATAPRSASRTARPALSRSREMRWARPLHEDGTLGGFPRRAARRRQGGRPRARRQAGGGAGKQGLASARAGGQRGAGASYSLCQIPEVSGALVAIDPHTGRVLALTGGFSFEMSQFNRATQAKRQEGSSIKPFVYLTALENGFTPSTLILDSPIALDQGPGLPKWSRAITRTAISARRRCWSGSSIRSTSWRRAPRAIVGMDAIAKTVESFGIMDKMPHEYSMSLGAGETTPLRLTAAYAMLVNGGKRITPTLIDRVQDRDGKTIYRADTRPCEGCGNVEWQHQKVPVHARHRASRSPTRRGLSGRADDGGRRAARHRAEGGGGRQADRRQDRHDQRLDRRVVRGLHPDLAAGVFVGYDEPVSSAAASRRRWSPRRSSAIS